MTAGGATRTSPPTQRVVAVLDHFVASPGRTFGLSELARDIGLSKPTCLGILVTLADAGYLVRDPSGKRYGLGPALITAGRAAAAGWGIGALAHDFLVDLSERFGAACSASAIVGDRIVVLDMVGPQPHGAALDRIGQSFAFAPPIGLLYVVWDRDGRLDRWLQREPALPVRVDHELLDRAITRGRADGYLVEARTAVGTRLHRVMAGVDSRRLPDEVRQLIAELEPRLGERILVDDPDHPRDVNLLAAPVHGPAGEQSMVVTLHVGGDLGRQQRRERGEALRRTADAITGALGGRIPQDRAPAAH